MKKYLTVFNLSFQNEFVYRLNFVLWRVRNVIRILMTFFLWRQIFVHNNTALGYSQSEMMSYVFLALLTSSFVIAAPSNDNIGAEIASGDLSKFLLKPFGYLRYWLTRDWASKLLNMLFAFFEVYILWLLFKPDLLFSISGINLMLGLIALTIASLIYFCLGKLALTITFWSPENTWGLMFIIMVFFEALSGAMFPLKVLPVDLFNVLQFTPFPYLVFFPIQIILGQYEIAIVLRLIALSLVWLVLLGFFLQKIWRAGLRQYSASGN